MNKISWPITDQELAAILGLQIGTIRKHKSDLKREGNLINEIDYVSEINPRHRSSRDFETWKWLEPGGRKVARRSRTNEAISFLKERGNENAKSVRMEHHYIDIIIKSLKNIAECKKNFHVIPALPIDRTYKIDLYLPKYKIAIECDETHHSPPGERELDRQRQKMIENILSCYFIRFNPLENNFNIGDVINKIMLIIIENVAKL